MIRGINIAIFGFQKGGKSRSNVWIKRKGHVINIHNGVQTGFKFCINIQITRPYFVIVITLAVMIAIIRMIMLTMDFIAGFLVPQPTLGNEKSISTGRKNYASPIVHTSAGRVAKASALVLLYRLTGHGGMRITSRKQYIKPFGKAMQTNTG